MKKWVTVAAHPTTPRPSLPGAGGLAVANQLYNKLKWDGKELGQGDIAIVDVSLVNPMYQLPFNTDTHTDQPTDGYTYLSHREQNSTTINPVGRWSEPGYQTSKTFPDPWTRSSVLSLLISSRTPST